VHLSPPQVLRVEWFLRKGVKRWRTKGLDEVV
jgi:hypothetical protein